MRKLYKLKKWYTVDEAARRLSLTLGEPIEPSDVLALMSDRELGVFWFLQDRYGIEVAPVTLIRRPGDAVYDLAAALHKGPFALAPTWYSEDLEPQAPVAIQLHGLYRIEDTFCGASASWVTSLSTGIGGDRITLDGTLLVDAEGRLWKLVDRFEDVFLRRAKEIKPYNHPDNFHPSTDRPRIDEIVVTREEMERFEARILDAEIPQPRGKMEDPGPWPWGVHETELLRHLAAAGREWWSTYDSSDPTTAPKNDEVSQWLVGRGVAKRTAEIMAQLLRADGLAPGPRR